jgi:hypothetical protein
MDFHNFIQTTANYIDILNESPYKLKMKNYIAKTGFETCFDTDEQGNKIDYQVEIDPTRRGRYFLKESPDFENLVLVHYTDDSDISNPIVKQSRGIIFDKRNNQIVCHTFEKSVEPAINALEMMPHEIEHRVSVAPMNFAELYRCEYSYDGTQIKLYHYNGEWRVATTRSINAFRSKWSSSKSFGEMFEDAVDQYPGFMERLNPEYVYAFVLMHPDNQIVVKYDVPRLVHVLTRVSNTWTEVSDVDLGVPKPERIWYESEENLLNDVWLRWTNQNKPNITHEGIMLVDRNGQRMKLLFEKYQEYKNLRGNMRRPDYRMLEMRKEPGTRMEFVDTYNLYDEFHVFEDRYQKMITKVHHYYMKKFIKRELQKLTDVPQIYRNLLYKLHQNYIITREVMTKERVQQLFLDFATPQLYFVYNRLVD